MGVTKMKKIVLALMLLGSLSCLANASEELTKREKIAIQIFSGMVANQTMGNDLYTWGPRTRFEKAYEWAGEIEKVLEEKRMQIKQ
jgi:hypothetical protein